MSRDTITRQREASENARAALQPFVKAWRALDIGLTDADRALFARVLAEKDYGTRRILEGALGAANAALCWAKEQIAEGAHDALLGFDECGVTFEQELNA